MYLIQLQSDFFQVVFGILLKDKNTGKNIIWATKDYEQFGENYSFNSEMTKESVNSLNIDFLQPRVGQSKKLQKKRTREKAEVFTSSQISDFMNTYCDCDWFGVGVKDKEGRIKFVFDDKKSLREYVDLKKLEITCGEAPFIVTPYDTTTGDVIPLSKRVGFLDRKLMAINQYINDKEEWIDLVYRAFENAFGYEYQGDSLLKARVNLLYTFIANFEYKWQIFPSDAELKKVSNIIYKNIWQMDGLTNTIPNSDIKCRVYSHSSKRYYDLIGDKKMKFDFIMGNPPYQERSIGDNENYATAVYNNFMDKVYQLSDKALMITPGRFLFNAGTTPKAWNEKMLNDKHFKVLKYYANSREVFDNVDIKGGVAIHYRDTSKDFGEIGVFTVFKELNSIIDKIDFEDSLMSVIYPTSSYRFTDAIHMKFPQIEGILSKGNKYILETNVFDTLYHIAFFEDKKTSDMIPIYGRKNGNRVFMYIERNYINVPDNFDKYKVFLPKSNGSGAFGEVLSNPLIAEPLMGHTKTFISIGNFDKKEYAENCIKYIKSKFARCMLGILKSTQHNASDTWKYVPSQDFTENSDIDWSKSISEIDQQLYKKYGLDDKEIAFIEEKVKEMQ